MTTTRRELYGSPPGTFTPWKSAARGHRSPVLRRPARRRGRPTRSTSARHADLKIGVVPVINLEWIQKLHRDRKERGYSTEAVTETILRRMPDYVNYICPQFTQTDINFQRVPTVDTSNPFIARWIPTPDELIVVIRFRNPRGIDFPYLLSMIPGSFMSRANSIVIPGVEARPRDAADPDAADPAARRAQAAGRMTARSRADGPRRPHANDLTQEAAMNVSVRNGAAARTATSPASWNTSGWAIGSPTTRRRTRT